MGRFPAAKSKLELAQKRQIFSPQMGEMLAEKIDEVKKLITKDLKEEITAMVVLKRADKRQYGNLQIELKIDIFSRKMNTQQQSLKFSRF